MKFFHFRQNNSFGRWEGPAVHLVVRAANPDEANSKAEKAGAYFDGGRDCPCCGNRWCRVEDWDGNEEPMIYNCVIEIPDLDKEFKYDEEDWLYIP